MTPPHRDDGDALAVVVKGYPRLSETFIAQELKALEDRGFRFDIWSLRAPYDDRVHPIHREIRATPRYLPEYLHEEPLRVLRSLWRAMRLPGFRRAASAFLADLTRDITRNRVRRFGQAAVLATELPAGTRFLYVHFLHTPGSVARYASMMRGLGWGVSAHAKDIWTTPAREIADKLADAAFAVTCTASGARYLTGLADGPEKVALAYHGLDLDRLPPPPERPGTAEGPITLLSVGRLVEKKGYDDLLAALARLPAGLDWRFVHIGGGKLTDHLKAEAAQHGLSARIDWRGKQDREAVIDAMRSADLFVLPSKIAPDGDRDGLPNVLMEAASQKLAIIATDAAAIPEFVENGRSGLLVPPSAPDALAAAIATLASDPARRLAMAEASHARLLAEFGMQAGIETVTARLAAALEAATPAGAASQRAAA